MRRLRSGAGLHWGLVKGSTRVRGCAYLLGLVAGGGLTACGDEVARDQGLARVHADLSAVPAVGTGLSCDALLAQFKSELLEQVGQRAEQARLAQAYPYGGVLVSDVVRSSPSLAPAPGSAAPTRSPSFSRTTQLVPGVEPGDFVKAEGDRIYLLHGSTLFVLAASASATEIVGSIAIDGDPLELVAGEGKVVVFSSSYGELPGLPPSYNPYYGYGSYTKLTVIEAGGAAPAVLSERYFDGYYSASNLIGDTVRAVVQQPSKAQLDYPSVSYVDIFGHPRSQTQIDLQVDLWVQLATQAIEDSTIEDYVNRQYAPVDGEIEALPLDCEALLQLGGDATQGSATLLAVDLADVAAPLEAATLLGGVSVTNLSDGTDLLWAVAFDPTDPSSVVSRLYLAQLDGTSLSLVASGSLPGYLQVPPSLEAGVLRAITTEDVYEPPSDGGDIGAYVGTVNRVVTLRAEQEQLVVLGQTPAQATGDYIVASSFSEDRGYLLLSGQDTRLSVVDLTDPTSPSIAGQVPVPGYGYTLVPLPNERVLVVTPYSDLVTFSQRLALRVVEASDPSAPAVTGEYSYTEEATSDAVYDIRALSLHPEQGLFALPVQDYTTGASSLDVFALTTEGGLTRVGGVSETQELPLETCLELLGYPADPELIAPELLELLRQQCALYGLVSMRRGLFRGDELFSISTLAVASHALDALAGPPLTRVELPAAVYGGGRPLPTEPMPAPIAQAPAEPAPAGDGPSE
ncbi:MAG: beta-propeller domain-containing protein [Deltaproteobacteria bacterium]